MGRAWRRAAPWGARAWLFWTPAHWQSPPGPTLDRLPARPGRDRRPCPRASPRWPVQGTPSCWPARWVPARDSVRRRGFLRAAMRDRRLDVPSPSFTLVQSYDTRVGVVHHYDLWRLDGPAALAELGWDEARGDIVLVEWPERLAAWQPAVALVIALSLEEGDARRAVISGWPDRLGQLA